MQHSIPSFCGTLKGCICILRYSRENASTTSGNATQATQLLWYFEGLCLHCNAPARNASTTCGSGTKATQLLWDFEWLCVHCNAPARKRDRNLWQRNVSQACYVALCRAVRAFAGKFCEFAAIVQKARCCVVLCTDISRCVKFACSLCARLTAVPRNLAGNGNCQRAARAQPSAH